MAFGNLGVGMASRGAGAFCQRYGLGQGDFGWGFWMLAWPLMDVGTSTSGWDRVTRRGRAGDLGAVIASGGEGCSPLICAPE